MRSSKSRSRSKQNRPRPLGNIINRVFESSGPEGKVRGTPQQIIEKYLLLARDAQLSNDRVAAENFLQHAEHYTRMLGEAQREIVAEQEARRLHQPQSGPERLQSPDGRERHNRIRDERAEERGDDRFADRPDEHPEDRRYPMSRDELGGPGDPVAAVVPAAAGASGLMPALGFADEDEIGLVDIPEARRPARDAAFAPARPAALPQRSEAGAAPQAAGPDTPDSAPGVTPADVPASGTRSGRGRGRAGQGAAVPSADQPSGEGKADARAPRRPRAFQGGSVAPKDDPAAAE